MFPHDKQLNRKELLPVCLSMADICQYLLYPQPPPCHSTSACHQTVSSHRSVEAEKAEKCKIESVNGQEETERVVTECDVLNPTGTFQHMLCTDASQFSLGLYYRQAKKPTQEKKKNKAKHECCRGCKQGYPSVSGVNRLLLPVQHLTQENKKDSSVTQLMLTCFINQLIFNLCIQQTFMHSYQEAI